MKKLTAVLLVMLFMAISLTGCGQKCDVCGENNSGIEAVEEDDGKTVNMCEKCREEKFEELLKDLESINVG